MSRIMVLDVVQTSEDSVLVMMNGDAPHPCLCERKAAFPAIICPRHDYTTRSGPSLDLVLLEEERFRAGN